MHRFIYSLTFLYVIPLCSMTVPIKEFKPKKDGAIITDLYVTNPHQVTQLIREYAYKLAPLVKQPREQLYKYLAAHTYYAWLNDCYAKNNNKVSRTMIDEAQRRIHFYEGSLEVINILTHAQAPLDVLRDLLPYIATNPTTGFFEKTLPHETAQQLEIMRARIAFIKYVYDNLPQEPQKPKKVPLKVVFSVPQAPLWQWAVFCR